MPHSVDYMGNPSNVPIPDPSVITAQEIAKAKLELREEFTTARVAQRELLDANSKARHDILLARLDAMDKASVLLEANVTRVPTMLDREASRLEKLFDERLSSISVALDGIQRQFHELDIRSTHAKMASDTAISTAFQAAKEAVSTQNETTKAAAAKSEASFTKEIDNIKSRVDGLSARQDRNDGLFQSVRQGSDDRRANTSIISAIAIGVGTLLLMGATVWAMRSSASAPAPAYYSQQSPSPTIAQIPQIPQLPQNQVAPK